jgi:tRNA dimethylallyltransferase
MTDSRLPPAIFLMGPTASGKTGLAVELAQRLPVELISVDSALVYRGMDIGTAKPDATTLARAPHHLIDIIEPTASYSAAQFRDDALRLMGEITQRGRVPLLVGGTMLYFNALQHGLNNLPQADPALRAEIDARAERAGWPALHAELAKVDPATAARLMPNDAQRIERALEIYHLTGRPMSELLQEEERASLPYRLLKIALLPSDRAVLHQRIAERFDAMLQAGLLDEVARLRRDYPALSLSLPSMRCVGYRHAWQCQDGEFDLATLRDKGIAATRQLAKRQMTWLRGMDDVEELDCLGSGLMEKLEKQVLEFIG